MSGAYPDDQTTGTKRPRLRGNARDLLLEAVSALMIEKDTIDVPLAEIAQRAGVNSSLVSYHFGGKEGLMLALVQRDTARGLKEMQALVEADLPPEEKLKKHLAGMINFNVRFPYLTRLIHELMRDPESDNARMITERFSKPVTEAERQILAEGLASGRFRRIDPLFFYVTAVGACDRLFWGSSTLPFAFGLDKIDDAMRRRFIEHTIDLLLNGCLTAAARSNG